MTTPPREGIPEYPQLPPVVVWGPDVEALMFQRDWWRDIAIRLSGMRVEHWLTCNNGSTKGHCTCGLDALRKAIEGAVGK